MAGVTPRQVYQALINAGASTIQAIGIMANGIAESGLNPEAVGDQGTSFGTWQQHGAGYAGLVTGNPQADLAAQVKVVAQNGGFTAASGSNAGEAAGNFAANYERCTTCQPGQASYNQRVANAATVAGWVSSGKWPTSAGNAAAVSGAASSSSATGADCAFGPNLPVVGQVCLVKKATIRHMTGAALMASGGGLSLVGVILLAAFAFRASGAQRAAGQVASTFTPAGRVYRAQTARTTAARTTAARQQAATARQAQQQGNTAARRAAGSGAGQQRRAVRGAAPAPARRRPPAVHHNPRPRGTGQPQPSPTAQQLTPLPPPP